MEPRKLTILYDAVEDQEPTPGEDSPVYQQVKRALERRGHSVTAIAADRKIKSLVAQIEKDPSDVIFNLCESLAGVDRRSINVASLLELLGKRFTGAGPLGLSLAQDKVLAKKVLSFHGIRTPLFTIMDAGQVEWSDHLAFPLIVKPADTDSSVGIDENAIVKNVKELMERISYIHTEVRSASLIEEYIEGREIYVACLGNDPVEALPIVEWDLSRVKGPAIATAKAKWDVRSEAFKAPLVFPEDIPPEVGEKIRKTAIDVLKALRIYDYGRVDMRLVRKETAGEGRGGEGAEWEAYVIEANPNPYLDQKAEFAMAAKKRGLAYPDLVERIIEEALARKR